MASPEGLRRRRPLKVCPSAVRTVLPVVVTWPHAENVGGGSGSRLIHEALAPASVSQRVTLALNQFCFPEWLSQEGTVTSFSAAHRPAADVHHNPGLPLGWEDPRGSSV